MKEAFLMGVMAMSANADDHDINMTEIVTPTNIAQEGNEVINNSKTYVYSITPEDNKASVQPHIVKHVIKKPS